MSGKLSAEVEEVTFAGGVDDVPIESFGEQMDTHTQELLASMLGLKMKSSAQNEKPEEAEV